MFLCERSNSGIVFVSCEQTVGDFLENSIDRFGKYRQRPSPSFWHPHYHGPDVYRQDHPFSLIDLLATAKFVDDAIGWPLDLFVQSYFSLRVVKVALLCGPFDRRVSKRAKLFVVHPDFLWLSYISKSFQILLRNVMPSHVYLRNKTAGPFRVRLL